MGIGGSAREGGFRSSEINDKQQTIMSKEKKKPSFWSPRSGVYCAAGFLALAGVPYLINGAKVYAETGKVSAGEVMKETKEKHEKKEKDHESAEKLREIKTAAVLADGTVFAGGKGGLAVRKTGEWSAVPGFPDEEVKSLAAGADGTLWVAGKKGLHSFKDGAWKTEREGDSHSVSVGADGSLALASKKGLEIRKPSGEWSEVAKSLPEAFGKATH